MIRDLADKLRAFFKDPVRPSFKPGNSFEASVDLMFSHPRFQKAFLVHGYVSGGGPVKGERFASAWLEMNRIVYDFTLPGKFYKRAEYYKGHKINRSEVKVYNYSDVLDKIAAHGTYGPWDLPNGGRSFPDPYADEEENT